MESEYVAALARPVSSFSPAFSGSSFQSALSAARSRRHCSSFASRTSIVFTFSTSNDVRSIQSALFAVACASGSETMYTVLASPGSAMKRPSAAALSGFSTSRLKYFLPTVSLPSGLPSAPANSTCVPLASRLRRARSFSPIGSL